MPHRPVRACLFLLSLLLSLLFICQLTLPQRVYGGPLGGQLPPRGSPPGGDHLGLEAGTFPTEQGLCAHPLLVVTPPLLSNKTSRPARRMQGTPPLMGMVGGLNCPLSPPPNVSQHPTYSPELGRGKGSSVESGGWGIRFHQQKYENPDPTHQAGQGLHTGPWNRPEAPPLRPHPPSFWCALVGRRSADRPEVERGMGGHDLGSDPACTTTLNQGCSAGTYHGGPHLHCRCTAKAKHGTLATGGSPHVTCCTGPNTWADGHSEQVCLTGRCVCNKFPLP